jgi:hypothetical protein
MKSSLCAHPQSKILLSNSQPGTAMNEAYQKMMEDETKSFFNNISVGIDRMLAKPDGSLIYAIQQEADNDNRVVALKIEESFVTPFSLAFQKDSGTFVCNGVEMRAIFINLPIQLIIIS